MNLLNYETILKEDIFMKKIRCKNAIISKITAIVLGVLVFSNVAV